MLEYVLVINHIELQTKENYILWIVSPISPSEFVLIPFTLGLSEQ